MKKYIILVPIILVCLGVYLAIVISPGSDQKLPESNNRIPKRVVSINPAATEIIFELGCEDKLVAVSDFSDYPPETKDVEQVGGVLNPNFERISMLKPDLIIIQGECENITKFCGHKNIEYMNINLRTIDEIYRGITELGETLGCPEAAEKLNVKIKNELRSIKKKLSSEEKKKVFFSLNRIPGSLASITTVGPNTFLSELINITGGINIFDDLKQDYPVISKETLLKRQPDIIIEPYFHSTSKDSQFQDALRDWSKLGKLNAVKNKNLNIIDGDLVLKPGPRVGLAALEMAKIIHPELFDE